MPPVPPLATPLPAWKLYYCDVVNMKPCSMIPSKLLLHLDIDVTLIKGPPALKLYYCDVVNMKPCCNMIPKLHLDIDVTLIKGAPAPEAVLQRCSEHEAIVSGM